MVFLPLKDDNPLKVIDFQIVTVTIIVLCAVAFVWQISVPEATAEHIVVGLGAIPAVLLGTRELPPDYAMVPAQLSLITLISSMFLHGGWMHLIGNMLYLWVFGDNVEDAMGHPRFLVFYLLCGVVGGLAHTVVNPDSMVPAIGASGAISGVLGAYLVMHPKVKVLVLIFYRLPWRLPAYVVLGFWIAMQIFFVFASAGTETEGGVAWWAHIGGFVSGVVLIFVFRRRPPSEAPPPAGGPWSRPG